MSNAPSYNMTNESITIVWEGKSHQVQKGTTNFIGLRNAIVAEDWDSIPNHLSTAKSLQEWAKGKFTLVGNTFSYEGTQLPRDLNDRITMMATKGESPEPLFNFWEKLQKNPSYRSVKQLWPFLKQKGIPFTKDGNFRAYKAVKSDYKDVHSGTFDNSPGVTNEMPRNQISDDPQVACHEGFHVGALEYAKSFHAGGRIVVCEIDPADVVCIPYDSSHQKMRVCKYKVIGNHNGEFMSSTVQEEEPEIDVDVSSEEPENEEDPDNEGGSESDDADPPGYDLEKDPLLSDEERVEARKKAPVQKADKVEKKLPKSKADITGLPRKPNAKLDDLKLPGLMEQSIEVLRKYAGKNLQITGASKIPGGKTALVAKILEVRKK